MARNLLKGTLYMGKAVCFALYFVFMVFAFYDDVPAAWHVTAFHSYFIGVCLSIGAAVLAFMLADVTISVVIGLYDVIEAVCQVLPEGLVLKRIRPYKEIMQ